jgi:hypothetical protein
VCGIQARTAIAAIAAIGLVLSVGSLRVSDARASFTARVTVITHELHNGQCLDGVFLGCGRPELRVDAVIDTNDGRPPRRCRGPTNGSFDFVIGDQSICSAVRVSGDFTVRLTLVDVDADTCAPTDLRCIANPPVEAADLTSGPGQAWETQTFAGGLERTQRTSTTGGPSRIVFSVSTAPVSTQIAMFAPEGVENGAPLVTFDPMLGEKARVRAFLTEPTRLQYTVTRRATATEPARTYVLSEGPFWNTQVNLDWDGRAPGSASPLVDGIYDLTLRDVANHGPDAAALASRPVRLQRTAPNAVEVKLTDVFPATSWDFRNGELSLRGTVTAGGSVRREVTGRTGGTSCSTNWTGAVWQGQPQQRPAGAYELTWDGRDSSGAAVPPGQYCIRVRLTPSTGVEVVSPVVQVEALPRSTGIEIWTFVEPIIPIQGRPPRPSIRAVVVDPAHTDRFAARVALEVTPAGTPGAPVALAAQTIGVCERARVCTAVLPSNLAGATAIAYRATASEAQDAPGGAATVTSAWRITDLNPLPSRTWRASVPAIVDSAGMVTTPRVSSTLDIVYYPGVGNDLSQGTQAQRFEAQVGGNIEFLFGLSSDRGPTTFASSSERVSFIVSPQNVVDVTGTGSQICAWSGIVPVSYAEAHGVLHHAGCRDAAYPHSREYSSDDARTDWHELHHALYGEHDEYCCDGGYGDGVNVYGSMSSCSTKSSPGSSCARLIDPATNAPATPAQTGWFRGDPLPDVMVFNDLVENADDRRAAAATFARCAASLC